MIDKYIFTYLDKPAEIGVEWSKYSRTLIQWSTCYFTQPFPYLVNSCGSVELGRQYYSTVNDLLNFKILRVIQSYWLSGFQSIKYISIVFIGDRLFRGLVHYLRI